MKSRRDIALDVLGEMINCVLPAFLAVTRIVPGPIGLTSATVGSPTLSRFYLQVPPDADPTVHG